MISLAKALDTYFPSLQEELNRLPDERVRPVYSMAEVVFAVIAMFLLKASSRNNFNESRRRDKFAKAFAAVFRYKMPHMDTAHAILDKIDPELLAAASIVLVKTLLKRGTLNSLRLLSGHHVVSVDGVKVATFNQPLAGTTKKESKNGVQTFTRSCLQARLTAANGFSIPILTEWIETADGASKEDCELNAFKRLASRLWRHFPKLSICLVGDALYANDTVFTLCASYGWKFIVTLKDKLKTVHTQIDAAKAQVLYPPLDLLPPDAEDGGTMYDPAAVTNSTTQRLETIHRRLEWLNRVPYREHSLSWLACTEGIIDNDEVVERIYYAWLTNVKLSQGNILPIERTVRLGRSSIENAFNTEKNRGYAMKHKYARKSFNAAKNYLTCMHIAEAISQLVVLSQWFRHHILDTPKATLKALWAEILFELRIFNDSSMPRLLALVPQNHCYR